MLRGVRQTANGRKSADCPRVINRKYCAATGTGPAAGCSRSATTPCLSRRGRERG